MPSATIDACTEFAHFSRGAFGKPPCLFLSFSAALPPPKVSTGILPQYGSVFGRNAIATIFCTQQYPVNSEEHLPPPDMGDRL